MTTTMTEPKVGINPQELLKSPEVREKISMRAYEIHESRGGQPGNELEDWLQAEKEILATVVAGAPSLPVAPGRKTAKTTKSRAKSTAAKSGIAAAKKTRKPK